ncbi:hypothetical protein TBLA_0E04940 [Henningerozyma blattae CBS 6284]|uniref:Putative 5'-nucleotidase C-terminal domain-containing protein n=1 Tax=Henningerozyma blattae (strain ATCC 34711 / CBS 6284 / DSM 70876 / NBRC 10599 / NRRL Y-10934 / UCD 77-7) TaxID=1071380 RepID=I2H591_HENB6|nr:hypothetical protein TBLA_0E04940 [Tetrapisispora blattae CBS 6284]CCH61543.1 hypothetical protein TBLA_0E04940 [Tetrapisispora blattae CBS 6284]
MFHIYYVFSILSIFCYVQGLPLEVENDVVEKDKLRPLILGQLNFLHTTDLHGWFGSHPNQINYNADFGDFLSFIELFKQRNIHENQDLIVVDTGDKVHGTGLSDASTPIGIYSQQIFNSIDYDFLTIGNHEIYTPGTMDAEYYNTTLLPKFKGKYISSNLEYIDKDGQAHIMGNRFKYFVTSNSKLRILALSFISPFKDLVKKNPRCNIIPFEEVLKDENGWFAHEVLNKFKPVDLDLILVMGHLQLRPTTFDEPEYLQNLHSILRTYYPNTIIQYFGGHSHIRDFVKLDSKASALQSGKLAETVGFLSISNFPTGDQKDQLPVFNRRYIDFNTNSFKFHLNISQDEEFPKTSRGIKLSDFISSINEKLNLTKIYGYISKSYYFNARPINSKENIYNWLIRKILPTLRSNSINDDSGKRIIMTNTGAIRYDLYKGNFTRNSEYIISPFPNEWSYIKLPLKFAIKINDLLNDEGHIKVQHLGPVVNRENRKYGMIATSSKIKMNIDGIFKSYFQCPFINDPELDDGDTTQDDYGCDGDDTPHNTVREYMMPNVVQYVDILNKNDLKRHKNDEVFLIFNEFMNDSVLAAINSMINNIDGKYGLKDIKKYSSEKLTSLIRHYVEDNYIV